MTHSYPRHPAHEYPNSNPIGHPGHPPSQPIFINPPSIPAPNIEKAHSTRTAQNLNFPSGGVRSLASSQELIDQENQFVANNRDNHLLHQYHHDQQMLANHYRYLLVSKTVIIL